ncbi:zinc-dependent metalloprotease family protein [Polaribacter sp. Q13]|uniref:reprolysin-like metallopeptidase n=1 Tax=Polaribacter sp. Q13 TaxID=2806551 RepID=UPI00193AEAD1|nr:zinc-dependent metalloprotease family protein [Polaribacter sp. Q13]QVY64012.1 T9SS type A sorting domain-containing protein [Polaribacter sp. Q13]
MNTRFSVLFIFIISFSSIGVVNAQNFLKKIDKNSYTIKEDKVYQKKNFPKAYDLVSIDVNSFNTVLKSKSKRAQKTIQLPNAKGGFSNFLIKEDSNFETKLSEKFSMIKSYSAQGIEDPTAVAKISVGTDGFHAVVYSGVEKTVYIDPYSKDNKSLIVYKRSDLEPDKDGFTCHVEEVSRRVITQVNASKNANDGKLRTFRLALVCSGEYAQFHLTNQNISTAATDEVKKAAVLSAMNTTMTRVNGVYERDLSVKMVIVGDNDKVIFLDAATDNITDGDPDTMLNEVQTICDAEIGNANYDIGHVFSIGGDGLAGGGIVCITGSKARGVTGRSQPIGDAYDIDYVAHEMGHQFGANHTQNNDDCNRNNGTAVEPGSASTIMGYAGICSPNVQSKSDDYFHAVSIAEMWSTIQSSASCAVLTDANNSAPTANAGLDYSIPKSTPFLLKGIGTDADGTASLTYNWEQTDNEVATMPPVATNSGGPMFRSLPSATSSERYMPELATVVAGSIASTWEVLPSVARDLNFSFLVRDNHAGGGSTARDNMKVTVEDADAFTVLTPSTPVTWYGGSTQAITWNKGTTDVTPINCQNVTIKLSIDGGLTFPIILKENTPNDGTEDVEIPENPTTSARIMVEAADNIFYNVNATNFTINSSTPTFEMTNTSGTQFACNTGNQSVSYLLNFDFVNGFSEAVSFTATGQPAGAIVSFNPTTISGDGNVTVNITGLNGVTPQAYTINVIGNSSSINNNIDLGLNITTVSFGALTLTSPANNTDEIDLSTTLNWVADSNASNYDVQVAADSGFTNIITSENVTLNEYSLSGLAVNTSYYWRVKAKNSCGEGSFSNVFQFKTLTPTYCASNFTDDVKGTEFITNVTFNTINNDSGNAAVNGYEDFKTIETTVKRGDEHQVSVTLDTGGYQDHVYVFVDWNQDFVFDKTSERYDLGTELADIGTKTFMITVPTDAKFGSTTMRVVIEYDDSTGGYGDGACDSDHLTEWGETEDYTVVVDNTASIDKVAFEGFNLYPNPTKGEFTLNLQLVNTDKVSVQLFDVRGRLIDEKKYYNTVTNFSKRVFFEKAASGLYLLKVTNGYKQTTRKLIIK